jgi:putative transposase
MTAKYACIQSLMAEFPVALMCRALAVSRAGFYAAQDRPPSARAVANAQLDHQIRQWHTVSRGTYGAPRIQHALRAVGQAVSQKRIARRLQVLQLRGRRPRAWRQTTQADPALAAPSNHLARDFRVGAPNVVWSADITYLPTAAGFLYLAVVLDVGTRKVIGWAMRDTLAEDLVLAALQAALATRRGRPTLHHSDRGSQYAGDAYQTLLARQHITSSMSRVGNCWDNAVTESFFATLKIEACDARPFHSPAEARAAILTYIERWYNPLRLHSSLGYRSPDAYERDRPRQLAA